MADADRDTCPRCSAPISSGNPARLCPRCLRADARGGQSEDPPLAPSSPEGPRRKLTPASAVAAIGTFLFTGLWIGNRRSRRRGHAEAHFNLGLKLAAQGKHEQAVAEYRAAIRLQPDHAEAHCELGTTLKEQGWWDEAITEFRAAIWLRPDLAQAHFHLADSVSPVDLDEAIAEYREAIRFQPNFAEAHYSLGLALRDQGKPAEAIAEFREARDKAQRGSKLAQLIERELAATDR
jgi:tetratricopeptide (TPR) repeat protein